MDRAVDSLWFRRTFQFEDRTLTVALLLRVSEWRPLKAQWWRKKEASIIGADLGGNFFLRCSDGSVRLWDHSLQTDFTIAPSVSEFCRRLSDG